MTTYVVLDAETYWSTEYSLSRLSHEEYIRHPQFMEHGWGVLPINGKARWLNRAQFTKFAREYDWSDTAIICHNTRFDGAILGWVHGIRPKFWIDTMGMYRALHRNLKLFSLANLAKHFGLADKGDASWTRGMTHFTPAQFAELGEYCKHDCYLTAALFQDAWERFPVFERAVMDMTLRMFIEPVLELDVSLLETALVKHQHEKTQALVDAGLDLKTVMSGERFADALRALGIEPPMKPSPTNPDRSTYAFAKTDAAMIELADHDDSRVQALVAARIGNKSTQLETRMKRLIDVGGRGTLPIPLNYWGALVTGRHSGADGLNMQNLTRGSVLRDAIKAPPGYKIVVGDSSNIELRLVMALAGQWDAIEKIRYYDGIPEKERVTDLYCDFATDIYGRTITKADEQERFVGKQGMLSLQYSASAPKFNSMLLQKGVKQPLEESERVVGIYRRKLDKVPKLWRHCEDVVLPAIARGDGLVSVDVNGWLLTDGNGFSVPGFLGVQYDELQRLLMKRPNGIAREQWVYKSGRQGLRSIFGAKVVENACQHTARLVVMFQGLLVRTRYPVVHSVHDELVCCVPEDQAEDCAKFMLECLSTAPAWTHGKLPVTGEVGIGDTYGSA